MTITFQIGNLIYFIIEELGAKTAKVTILDHPSQNIQIIYLLAMLQWPNESYYVANTLFL